MTRSVLWDLDGTLIDSEQYHWLAWRDTMAAEGVSLTHEQFIKTFGLRNDSIVPRWIPGVTPERIQQIAGAKEQHYRRLVRDGGLEPLPGVRHWTERLARDAWRQAIASSAPRENVDAVLAVGEQIRLRKAGRMERGRHGAAFSAPGTGHPTARRPAAPGIVDLFWERPCA